MQPMRPLSPSMPKSTNLEPLTRLFAQSEALESKHSTAPFLPISQEEVAEALVKIKPSTATGLDSVCYSAIRYFHLQDHSGKLCSFLNRILDGTHPVPSDWVTGKICLIPKIGRPQRVQDMRPISLTPCLGKVFSKILVNRLRAKFPPTGRDNMPADLGPRSLRRLLARCLR